MTITIPRIPTPVPTAPVRVTDAVRDALAILAPVDCAGCGRADRLVCRACSGLLGTETESAARTTVDDLPVVVAGAYDGVLRRLVLAYKDEGRTALAADLAPLLASSVSTLVSSRDQDGDPVRRSDAPAGRGSSGVPAPIELVTAPTRGIARRRRGYEPVPLLVRRAGSGVSRVVRTSRGVADQIGLGRAERAQNLAGSFVARMPLTGRRFVIVDDVVTSGATVRELRRAVGAAGGTVIGAAALARVPPAGAHRAPCEIIGNSR